MRASICAAALALLALAGPAQAQLRTTAPGMPPGDEGQTRGALTHSLLALAYADLNARAVRIEAIDGEVRARERQVEVRAKLLELIGGPVPATPAKPRVTRRSEGEGFSVENIVYDALPGMHVTANLYLPAGTPAGKSPAIIAFPGHGPAGKLSYYSFGIFMARQGVAVLAVDLPGEGEMLQYADPATGKSRVGPATSEHMMDGYAVAVTGDHVSRYFLALGMRGIDTLAARPDIDPARIAAYGCSGGGTVATYVAGLDQRVRAAAIACYMTDLVHLLPVQGPQEAEQTLPRFTSSGLDLPDWMELAAPKPYAIVSTTEDFFPFTGARAAWQEGRAFWGHFGKADALQWIHGPGGHGNLAPVMDRIADFFLKALAVTPPATREPPPPSPAPADWAARLQVTATGQVATSLGGETIQSLNAKRAAAIRPPAPDNTRLAAAARKHAGITAVPGDPPKVDMGEPEAADGLFIQPLTFQTSFGALPAALVSPPGEDRERPVILLMEESGLDPRSPLVRALVAAKWRVLALHARGADGIERGGNPLLGNQNRMALRALVVGRTLAGIRTDDLIAALDMLQSRGTPRVALMATGSATVPAAHAALLDGRIGALVLQGGLVSWREALTHPMQRNLPPVTIPGALRDYDLPDLLAATRACRVVVIAPRNGMGEPVRPAAPQSLDPAALRCS
jgi:dienelactone hydrolase